MTVDKSQLGRVWVSPVVLVAAACTTIVGLPDLPEVAQDGGAGRGAGGTSGSGGGGMSGAGDDGGSGGTPMSGGSSTGGAGPASGGTDATGGTDASGGTAGMQAGGTSGTSGGSDVGTGGSETGGSSTGGSNTGGSSTGGSNTGGSSTGGSGTGGAAGTGGASNAGRGGSGGAGGGGGAGMAGAPSCTQCGGSCVFLTTNEDHCGACDYACVNGRECVDGRCTPAWQPIATAGAPAARSGHAAAFVAGKYVVMGGSIEWDGPALDNGGAYDPATDTWSAIASLKTGRCGYKMISSGTEIYAFGGLTSCGNGNTVGPSFERFVPDGGQGTWTTINATGTPSPRYNLNMLWTGSSVVVYAGSDGNLPSLASGGRFDPTTNQWTDATCGLTHCDRTVGAFFMQDGVAHFMGGEYNEDYPDWMGNGVQATSGFRYDPVANSWSSWPHPAGTGIVSTGPQVDDGRRIYFPSGGDYVGIYDRETGWLPADRSKMPSGLCGNGAAYAWSGTELIGWSGNCSPEATLVGGRFQPAAPP